MELNFKEPSMRSLHRWPSAGGLTAALGPAASAGGILTPVGTPETPVQIREHHVDVVISQDIFRISSQHSRWQAGASDLAQISNQNLF